MNKSKEYLDIALEDIHEEYYDVALEEVQFSKIIKSFEPNIVTNLKFVDLKNFMI